MPDLTLTEAAERLRVTLEPSSLFTKLSEVAAEITHVEKDGFNDFQKYKYTSAEAMLTALRGPLTARNVTLLESVDRVEDREYVTAGKKASVVTTVLMTFTFVDGDTGETRECRWAGRGDDAADKGLGKAYTNAVKTFLRAQFLVPQGDDPEADTSTDKRAADRAPSGPPAQEQEAGPVTKPISWQRCGKLRDAIDAAGLAPQLPMAVGHVTGKEIKEGFPTETYLARLTTPQADAIQRWVDKHSEPAS